MDYTLELPAETLCQIFHHVQLANSIPTAARIGKIEEYALWLKGQDLEPEAREGLKRFRLAWITLTYVCSRWRKLALADASLWADIPVTLGCEWLRAFIERSDMHPISIDWQSAEHTPFKSELGRLKPDVVEAHYRRLRNFRHAFWKSDDPLFPLLSYHWPELEDFNVSVLCGRPVHNLLANNAPRLRKWQCSFGSSAAESSTLSMAAPFVNTLVVLKLDLSGHGVVPETSTDALLDALGRMPFLGHLSLSGGSVPVASPSSNWCSSCFFSSPRTQKIALKTLRLAGSHAMIAHIAKHIILPPSVQISLLLLYNYVEKQNLSIFDALDTLGEAFMHIARWRRGLCEPRDESTPANTPRNAPSPYTSLEVDFDEPGFTRVRLANILGFAPALDLEDWYKGVHGVHAELEMYIPLQMRPGVEERTYLDDIMCEMLSTLAANSIRALALKSGSGAGMLKFLGSLTGRIFHNVEIFRVPIHIRCVILEFLATIDDAQGSTGSSFSLFPALKVLDIIDTSLKDTEDKHWIDAFKKLLSVRRGHDRDHSVSSSRRTGLHVFLHTAEEVAALREAKADEVAVSEHTRAHVEELVAVPGVKLLGKNEVASYVALDRMWGVSRVMGEGRP